MAAGHRHHSRTLTGILAERTRPRRPAAPQRTLGAWTLTTNDAGDLVAVHDPTGTVHILAPLPDDPPPPPAGG